MAPLILIASLLATPAEPSRPVHWYGWQTLLTDAAAAGTSVATATQWNQAAFDPLLISTVAVYSLGAPLVHALQGRGKAALSSLILRVGLPIAFAPVGFYIGAAGCGGRDPEYGCAGAWFFVGAAAGAVTASLVDAFMLANEPVPESPPITPQVGWIRDRSGDLHPSFGLAGRF